MKQTELEKVKPNEKQKKSLEWALKFVEEDAKVFQALKNSVTSKRDRSMGESPREPKRHKPVRDIKNIDGMLLNEVGKQHLCAFQLKTSALSRNIL